MHVYRTTCRTLARDYDYYDLVYVTCVIFLNYAVAAEWPAFLFAVFDRVLWLSNKLWTNEKYGRSRTFVYKDPFHSVDIYTVYDFIDSNYNTCVAITVIMPSDMDYIDSV
jgi:hypothetical protein